jgi:hypothetical protein
MIQGQVQARYATNRQASPARWQRAAQRAIAERISVRQVNTSGMWVASSGSDPTLAYLVEITNGVAHSCTCPAGDYGDPVCKHRARFYLDAGVLTLDGDGPDDTPLAA